MSVCPVIIGPTAVGKTKLVTCLAAQSPIEVISLDSRQVYHGLRIGTAQPSAAELAVCPHHLIDFLPPTEKYDAIRYRRDFSRVYQEIQRRGKQPVLVGGAGLYLKALREGFMAVPGQTAAVLARVRTALDQQSDQEIRTQLQLADPASCDRLHENDRYRNQRALEIYQISGVTMSDLMAAQQPDPALGVTFRVFVLERDVGELDARISDRTGTMLAGGWLAETAALWHEHPATCPGLLSIGYREIVRHLSGELTADELEEAIVLVTRQYAKRQRTLLRHLPEQTTWHPDDERLPGEIRRAMGDRD